MDLLNAIVEAMQGLPLRTSIWRAACKRTDILDLQPNADEEQVIDMARAFLSRAFPVSRLHFDDRGTYTAEIARQFAELGWFGMGLAEADGGFGFSAVDETLLFRELGRYLGPLAVLPTCLAARIAAADANTALATSLIAGDAMVALALADPNRREAHLFEINDAAYIVAFVGSEAQLLDVRTVIIESRPSLDKAVSMGRADLSTATVLARADAVPLDNLARLLTAAMLVGTAEAMTDMISEYAKIRHTFGRPIGAYQAVRHPIAEMAVRAFAARNQLFLAAVSMRDHLPGAALQIDAAKILANDAALRNADANLQLHGGISTTDEHDAHFFLKRAHVLAELFGNRSALDRLLATRLAN